MSRSFGRAYARGELSTTSSELLPPRHRTSGGRRGAVAAAASRGLDPHVAAAIRVQNPPREDDERRAASLAKLAQDDVTFVVTGQQVGLFVGPLYSLWKAATAVAWAERLEAETGSPVVPLFWLQTEDHDLEEIATCVATDRLGGVHDASASDRDAADRSAIAHRRIANDVVAAVDHLSNVFDGLPHADATLDRLRAVYRPGVGWADAFADLFGSVFANSGLLMLQPRLQELARLALPVHRWAIEEHEQLAKMLEARGARLREDGWFEQVPVRADCALSFFHPDGPDGPRYRLRQIEGEWRLADGEGERVGSRVEAALTDEPLAFSTSALLRPLVQDTLLPSAAYVGGPGEISYWAQLPPLYEARGLSLPLVIPRATGVIVDDATWKDLDALGLSPGEVDRDVRGMLSKLGPPDDVPDFDELPDRTRDAIREGFRPARERAERMDPQLASAFEKTEQTMMRYVGKLRERLERAVLRADDDRVATVRRVVSRLRPRDVPQDRSLCWPDLAARLGADAVGPVFLRAVREAVEAGREGETLEVTP